MAVYTVRYNVFWPDIFISASADWTIKIWDHNEPSSILTFDLNSPVGDVAWSPYSSSVFAAATADGKVYVYDLNENKTEPVCEQQVVKKSKLTHIRFSIFDPILLIGDDKGNVTSVKLSPNVRKVAKGDETEAEKLSRILKSGK